MNEEYTLRIKVSELKAEINEEDATMLLDNLPTSALWGLSKMFAAFATLNDLKKGPNKYDA